MARLLRTAPSDYFFTDERRRFTCTSSRAKSTRCVRELVLPEDAEAVTTLVTLTLLRHNVHLRLGNRVLNDLHLLVHSRLLLVNDRFRLVFCHCFLVMTRARWCGRSWALGRRRSGS